MTDTDLRDLLTEFDELTIKLSPDGLVASFSDIPVATAPTLTELLTDLTVARVTGVVTAAINDPDFRTPRRPRGHVVKADRDHDLYCEWSRMAGNAGRIGTRAQMAAAGHAESALVRADAYGTSARSFTPEEGSTVPTRPYGWDTAGFLVDNQQGPVSGGWLVREQLASFLDAIAAGEDTRAGQLLTELD